MLSRNFKPLFFGSDHFSIIVVSHFVNKNLFPVSVVTRPGSELDIYSIEKKLCRHRWPLDCDIGTNGKYNIGLVASFGQLLQPELVQQFELGLYNVHPSLLPQYRGSSPIQAAILNGLTETGCSIMRIPPVAKFDIGDIILQEKIPINRREYAHELRYRLAHLGAVLTANLLSNFDECLKKAQPQSDQNKSYAKKIKPEQGLLDFTGESSAQIDRKVRAYTKFIDLYTVCSNGLKIKLGKIRDPDEIEDYNLDLAASTYSGLLRGQVSPPGTIYFHKPRHLLGFKCADGRWVAFDEVTPELKTRMTSLEFYNGYMSSLDGTTLTTNP